MRRTILTYPDPFLDLPSAPVEKVDESIRTLVEDMFETMYAADGVGLAAPQVGVGKRVIVVDVSPADEHVPPFALVNPRIVARRGLVEGTEGCLSVPGVEGVVKRAAEVDVEGLDEFGRSVYMTGTGILSRALQHEIDHLDGVLFIRRLAPAKP
jgi:peptide deformylase